MNIKRPRGTNDILVSEVLKWQKLENILRDLCVKFGINEIRTPMFEYTQLFQRGVGETTDIVQKEMFCFKDRGDRDYALRPEGTAGACRALIENKLYADVQPTKLYYISPSFRDERNQAGRFKQFHQFGVEAFGSYDASSDAEVISFMNELINTLGLKNVELRINSLGGNECRIKYNETLKNFIGEKLEMLCPDCRDRFERNPLRILDCKNEKCKEVITNAPRSVDCLDKECKIHFENLKSNLDSMGIEYIVDPQIVRGLDYYTRTVFEFICKSDILGSQSTICGGGRYDNLVKECGGPDMGAVGFAIGIERMLILLEEQELFKDESRKVDLYIGSIGDNGHRRAQKLAYEFRQSGLCVEYDTVKRSVKAQLKYADKINADYVVVLGDNEVETGIINLKNMKESTQEEMKIEVLKDEILKRRQEN